MQMIRPRPTHADQMIMTQFNCVLDVVFQLAPFISGNDRMKLILTFNPELHITWCDQGVVNLLDGRLDQCSIENLEPILH